MNIFKLASGDVRGLLTERPFLTGEVFTQTQSSSKLSEDKYLIDAATGAKIYNLYAGDIYGGTGEWYQNCAEAGHPRVWQLGSGNALKFSNKFITVWGDSVVAELKSNPNTVYIYVGKGTSSEQGTAHFVTWKEYAEGAKAGSKPYFEAGDAGDWSKDNKLGNDTLVTTPSISEETAGDYLNSGDLVFYSPVMQQVVVLHLSRSQDSLVRLQVADFVSKSMQSKLGLDKTVTLQDFFNGELRHYQYFDKNGWSPVFANISTDADGNIASVDSLSLPSVNGEVDDGDGYIHYVPFNFKSGVEEGTGKDIDFTLVPGKSYKIRLDNQDVEVQPGDLILSVPAEDGTVTHTVISLYGSFFNSIASFAINRADAYAKERWAVEDAAFLADIMSEGSGKNPLLSLIENLYETKVDVDPITKKIVTSQLPDFVLGAMKYAGSAASLPIYSGADEQSVLNTPEDILASLFVTTSSTEAEGNTESLDGDRDAWLSNTDTKALVGNYWIYTGPTIEYGPELASIFTNATQSGNDIKGDGTVNKAEEDEDGNLPTEVEAVVHELHSGDYIIWNGTNFDVVDNSESLIGISFKDLRGRTYTIQGVASILGSVRTTVDSNIGWKADGTVLKAQKNANEISTSVPSAENAMQIDSKDTVLFRLADGTLTIADNYIPFVNAQGVAYNSRFHFVHDGDESVSILEFLRSTGADDANRNVRLNFNAVLADDVEAYVFNSPEHRFIVDYNGIDDKGFDLKEYLEISDHPSLQLPGYSGTLTTEEYVNTGFGIIEGLLDELNDNLTTGTVDWLRTIGEDEDGNNVTIDSHFKQILVKAGDGASSTVDHSAIKLSMDPQEANVEDANDHANGPSNNLTVLADLSTVLADGKLTTSVPDWHKALVEGANGKFTKESLETVKAILKLAENTEDVENYLPNHGGVLLNSNSVIDCGVYSYTEAD